jgi:spermidine synthase
MEVGLPQRRWFLGGVLLTCMCGLMLQIMETRVLSIMAYYHLAFFSIGLAMLGMTAGALFVYYRWQGLTAARLAAILARVMLWFAWSCPASLVVLLSLALKPGWEPNLQFAAVWAVAVAVLLPPYILLGIAISLALTRSAYPVGLVYGVDLVGASLGCLTTLALLSVFDTYTAIILVGAVGLGAAGCFAMATNERLSLVQEGRLDRATAPRFALLLSAAALLLIAGLNWSLGTRGIRPTILKGPLNALELPGVVDERWNSFSRVSLVRQPNSKPYLWSASKKVPDLRLDQAALFIDGSAGTAMYHFGGNRAELEFLRYDATALAYFIRNQGRSAVIGLGGGRDVLTASVFGFRDITALEYNPIFARLFTKDYGEFSGAGTVPGLQIVVDDARSWFARSSAQFDLIQMSMIDTWAATGAGAFSLSENGLYTVDGWKRFMAHLSPTGVFTVSRWFSPADIDETARVVALAMATLIESGTEQPATHIYLAANGWLSTLIVGRAPLTTEDRSRLDAAVADLGYTTLIAPGRASAAPLFDRILAARTTDELGDLGRHYRVNVSPTWDRNPFFFNQLWLSDPLTMWRDARGSIGVIRGNLTATLTLFVLVALSMLFVMLVLMAPAAGSIRNVDPALAVWGSAYFVIIGLGFMLVEMGLIQRMSLFLGHPVYGLAIVLFSLILATGIGSLVSGRAVRLEGWSTAGWPLALAAYLASLPLWLGSMLEQTESATLLTRALLCVAVILPAGIPMGFMFPTGMRLAARIDARPTPWLWAVNGAAGVLGSGTAVMLSIQTSLDHTVLAGAGCYALLSMVGPMLLRLSAARVEPVSAALVQSPMAKTA